MGIQAFLTMCFSVQTCLSPNSLVFPLCYAASVLPKQSCPNNKDSLSPTIYRILQETVIIILNCKHFWCFHSCCEFSLGLNSQKYSRCSGDISRLQEISGKFSVENDFPSPDLFKNVKGYRLFLKMCVHHSLLGWQIIFSTFINI